MKHSIPIATLGPLGKLMADAVTKCVHCGFCLPACPTYTVLGEEMDSPRGRIILMKSVLEGGVRLEDAIPYIDRCLGCLGCTTACPSGVPYGELITPFRGFAEERRQRPVVKRLARKVTRETLPYPSRFRLAAKAGYLAKPIGKFLPTQFQAMLKMLPDSLPPVHTFSKSYPAQGKRRARVGLLTGCVQEALSPQINQATLRVLTRNGIEVVIPSNQGCCGALALHMGDLDTACRLASALVQLFPVDVDAILTNAAGCGSSIHEYPLLFQNTEQNKSFDSFSRKVMDISVYLDQLGIESPPPLTTPLKVAYHDPCHLAHAQGITAAPRHLLEQIPNLTIIPVSEGDLCCGSAGSYNLEQPEIADLIGERKVKNILATEAEVIITGNIGCLVQLQNHLKWVVDHDRVSFVPPQVLHTIEMLDRAYTGWRL